MCVAETDLCHRHVRVLVCLLACSHPRVGYLGWKLRRLNSQTHSEIDYLQNQTKSYITPCHISHGSAAFRREGFHVVKYFIFFFSSLRGFPADILARPCAEIPSCSTGNRTRLICRQVVLCFLNTCFFSS